MEEPALVTLRLTEAQLARVLPQLLRLWPTDGRWPRQRKARLAQVLADLPRDRSPKVDINGSISRAQLGHAGGRLRYAYFSQIPWQQFTNRGTGMRMQALKLRPGAQIPITVNNVQTTAYINSIRRISKSGKPTYIKTDLTISTENIPIILERESKCDCLYCGTRPRGDETSCQSCGAPLPDC